jgi:hypothetical protein
VTSFALGTYAQRELLRHTNSPPHDPETVSPTNVSYDSYCSFVVNQVKRALELFPEEEWLHTLLACAEGQIQPITLTGTEATVRLHGKRSTSPVGHTSTGRRRK